jgi:hypothetical protein
VRRSRGSIGGRAEYFLVEQIIRAFLAKEFFFSCFELIVLALLCRLGAYHGCKKKSITTINGGVLMMVSPIKYTLS